MYKPGDKDIDRLSKDAAEHYQAPGKPAWDALQQILDKELPQEKEKKRRGFFFFFLVLLGITVAGSGLWYFIQNNNQHKSISLKNAISAESNGVTPATEKHSGEDGITAAKNEAGSGTISPENASPDKNAPAANAALSKTDLKNKPAAGTTTVAPTATETAHSTSKKDHLPVPVKNHEAHAATAVATNNILTNKSVPVSGQTASSHFTKTGNHAPAPVAKNNTVLNKPIFSPRTAEKQFNSGKQFKNSTRSSSGELITNSQKPTRTKIDAPAKRGIDGGTDNGIAGNTKSKINKKAGSNINSENTATTETGIEKSTDPIINNGSADITKNDSAVPGKNDDVPVAQTDAITAKADTAATAAQPVIQTDKKDAAAAAKKKTKSKNEKAINIGLTAGFDYSTIKFTYGQRAGYNIGLMGGYQFSSHWSVYTGVIYTKKNYALNGSDYHPPKHYWTQYVDLQKVTGYCRMWEVPLLARYTFNPGAKTAFFASTGISSYFMKVQQYDYDYKNAWGVPATASWNNDSSSNHIFSILHLSAGFEKRLGKHLNWQIEPYAKIPLGGVGFGNIRLSSFGVNFSVQYRHPVKR